MSEILVIGEERIITLDIEQALKRSGYEVEVVRDKVEGLAKIFMYTYDLIILSLLSRDDAERQYYNQVHAFSKDEARKILFVTAKVTDFIKLTGNPYLVKPFTDEELLETVKKLLP